MLTMRATLEPDGHLTFTNTLKRLRPTPVLVTFLEEPELMPSAHKGNAAAALELLQSPAFCTLPKSDAAEIEQRIAELRNDWKEA